MNLPNWKGDALALIAGAILPLAFAPLGWWPIVFISLFAFMQMIDNVSTQRAAIRGYLFGLGYFGVGVSWVYISIRLFGNATAPLAAGITVLFILILSIYTALTAWLARYLSSGQIQLPRLLAFPLSWVCIEWLRGWLFTGFGWLQIGYAFVGTPLQNYASWVGVSGISLLVALMASAVFSLLMQKNAVSSKLVIAALPILIWGLPTIIPIPTFTAPYGEARHIALMQANIPQHLKWHSNQRQPTLDWYRQATERHWGKDIIVWPEAAIPAFQNDVQDYLKDMHAAARHFGTTLMTGLPIQDEDGQRYYNGLIVLGNAGRGEDTIYRKQHLVPFGEYLPLKFMLQPILGFLEIPMSDFSAGEYKKPLVTAGDDHAGVFICYEIAFGADVTDALPGADYLVNISNDAWFGNSLAPYQHLQIAQMRALETGRYILRATNTGISAIIRPDGLLDSALPQGERGVLQGEIRLMRGVTVYSLFGDYPLIALAGLVFMWCLYRRLNW